MKITNVRRKRLACLLIGAMMLLAAGDSQDTRERRLLAYVQQQIDSLDQSLGTFERLVLQAPDTVLHGQFRECRRLYKRIEFLAEYFFPANAAALNGAPLLEAEPSEPRESLHPSGFQVLEEIVFDTATRENRLMSQRELSSLRAELRRLSAAAATLELNPGLVMDALRTNLFRLIAKGLSGFDVPLAGSAIAECAETLLGTAAVLEIYDAPEALLKQCRETAALAAAGSSDFTGFDRAGFLQSALIPFMNRLQAFRSGSGIRLPQGPRAIRETAATPFDRDAFDPLYFAPAGTPKPTQEQIALGRTLFYDAALSSNGQRSCGSCHKPELAFTDGLAVNESLLGNRRLLRNTPTLLNAALQPAQFADSRMTFLEDQVHVVIADRNEMGGDLAAIVARLRKSKAYRPLIEAAGYSGKGFSQHELRQALAAYVRSLTRLNAPFDRYMRGDTGAMTARQVAGFNLFMGKARCGTCHYAPLFNGAVPPLFDKIESEVLGVPAGPDSATARLDADSGKFNLYKMPHQLYAFKTSGLRNVALTAPYMHNGVYRTLEEVLQFYNRGGGAGLGLNVPTQTLSPDRLDLSAGEQASIIAFMQALTDTAIINKPPARPTPEF